MNVSRTSFSLLFAAALVVSGCHSNRNQQADNQNPDQQQPTATSPDQSGSNPHQPRQHEPRKGEPRQPTPPPPPQVVELPVGTQIRVRLDQDLSSKDSRAGEAFSATVADDVVANGTVIIPKDSRADGTVVDAKPLGKFKGGALLSIRLDRVHSKWGTYPVETASISRAEKGKGKRTAAFIGGGAGIGALIGGLAGGGAGTAGGALTGNKQIELPAETLLPFQLQNPVPITESNNAPSGDPQLQNR